VKRIEAAVLSGSVDAIIAEVERTEKLICSQCIGVMTGLLDHDRYEVRQVAGWWFAKRPAFAKAYADQMIDDMTSTDSIVVRNAADYLGTVKSTRSLPALDAALAGNLSAEARMHIVRAAGRMGVQAANGVLVRGMSDADPTVRYEAVKYYRDILGQTNAAPVRPVLGDGDAVVRAEASATLGGMRDAGSRVTLEQLVVGDPDATVRRNAAWALGRIGDAASRAALETAQNDTSSLVRMTAKQALIEITLPRRRIATVGRDSPSAFSARFWRRFSSIFDEKE
jgi:HEAT repeat protein